MAWFAGQLALLLVLAFGLGLLLGYLMWIFGWRKRVQTTTEVATHTESVTRDRKKLDALEAEKRSLAGALAQRDARIAQLEEELATAVEAQSLDEEEPNATTAATGDR